MNVSAVKASPLDVTPETLVARAEAMVPVLRERAQQTQDDRKVVDQTIEDFKQAGFFRVLQQKEFGGYEMDPQVFFDIQIKLAEGCMSSAWVYGVVAIHNFQMALFDKRASEDVWGEDDSVLLSSSYQPVGKVTPVEGGFKLSGRWGFSSGCDHCDWVLLGAMIPPAQEGAPPDMRTFLVPRADYEIIDTWHVYGLQGTGSQDILVEDAFVPEYRTHRAADGFQVTNPGNTGSENPIYRIPWAQLFVRAVSSSAIGATQGALDAYCGLMAKRVSTNTGTASKSDPPAQSAAARAMLLIDELKLVLQRNIADMTDAVKEGREIPVNDRVKYRYDSAMVAQKCIDAVDGMMEQCGGRGIYLQSPMVRYFLDLHAARAHVANEPERYASNLGGIHFGQDNQDFFV